MPPVSSFGGPVAELIAHGMLSPPSRPGLLATLDHFEILRVLGAGGMGIVLLARDERTERQVALKLVRPELLGDARVVHLFVKEARHLQRLRHPNVIEVTELSDREAGPYFVMPYFENGNLARRIQPGKPLEAALVIDIALQVCEGLLFAHRRGIIHRDLKPANILLTTDGRACLADFGLARTLFNDSIVDVENQQCEGTASYMSPGVAAGNAEDTRCDIYALGALLYEMLTGQPPYQGRTTKEIRRQILAQPPQAITTVNPRADRALASVAEGAMGRELRDRYADMSDVLADLQRVKEGKPPLGPHGIGRNVREKLQKVRQIPIAVWPLIGIAILVLLSRLLSYTSKPEKIVLKTPTPPPSASNAPIVAPAASVKPAPVIHGFRFPWGVAVDGAGNVYAADREDCTICRITAQGQVAVLAGKSGYPGATDGPGNDARFIMPRGIAEDSAGNVFVADSYTIRKISPAGEVSTLAGLAGYPGSADGPGDKARFSWPAGIAVDSADNLYVADRYTIRKITPAGWVTTLAGVYGRGGSADGLSGKALFSDQEKGIAVDGAGAVYVADAFNHAIRKISPAGAVSILAGSAGQGSVDGTVAEARFFRPLGIALAGDGTVYVADTSNDTIRKITPAGAVSTMAGTAGHPGSADGAPGNAQFDSPQGLAVDKDGNVYVADTGNRLIRKMTPAGVVSTLAGKK